MLLGELGANLLALRVGRGKADNVNGVDPAHGDEAVDVGAIGLHHFLGAGARRDRLRRPPAFEGDADLVEFAGDGVAVAARSEEQTSELKSLMRISYAVFCLKKKKLEHENHSARYE